MKRPKELRLVINGWGERVVPYTGGNRFQTSLALEDGRFVALRFQPESDEEWNKDPVPMFLFDVEVFL